MQCTANFTQSVESLCLILDDFSMTFIEEHAPIKWEKMLATENLDWPDTAEHLIGHIVSNTSPHSSFNLRCILEEKQSVAGWDVNAVPFFFFALHRWNSEAVCEMRQMHKSSIHLLAWLFVCFFPTKCQGRFTATTICWKALCHFRLGQLVLLMKVQRKYSISYCIGLQSLFI